jgi:hypothetical protein
VKGEKVNPNGNEHANVKGDPKPNARCHGRQVFMSRAFGQSQIARSTDATYTS